MTERPTISDLGLNPGKRARLFRGSAFQASGGGADSFYAVDYAARGASELGADMVKVKFPHPEKRAGVPAGYDDDFSPQQAMEVVVRSAPRLQHRVLGETARFVRGNMIFPADGEDQ